MATHDQLVEYKVFSQHFTAGLEEPLNALARQGWRVVTSFHEAGKVRPTLILERPVTLGVVRD